MDVGRLRQIGVFADMSETDLRWIAAFATMSPNVARGQW